LDAAAVAAIVNETACDDDPSGAACAAEERARQAMLAAPSYLPTDAGGVVYLQDPGDKGWAPAPATAYAGSAVPLLPSSPKPGNYQVGTNPQAVQVLAEPNPQGAAIIADPDLANGTKGVDNGAVYQFGGAQYGVGNVGTGVIQGKYVQKCTDGQCYEARDFGGGVYGPWYSTEHGMELPGIYTVPSSWKCDTGATIDAIGGAVVTVGGIASGFVDGGLSWGALAWTAAGVGFGVDGLRRCFG
jgi:hypothetical protein